MVVFPYNAEPVTAVGLGLAVKDRPSAGHGAFTPVKQTLFSKIFAFDMLRMSTPSAGIATATWTAGLPVTMFLRITFPSVPAARNTPVVFPPTMLFSISLSLTPAEMRPMPKLVF
jgi:hypothetical protein